MKFRPLNDNVLVKRLDATEEKFGGIIIPDTAKEKPQEANVLAVGPGKMGDDGTRRAVGVAVGNKVLFGKYAGTEITIEGEELLVIRESDVLGVIE
ncbi:MAG: co-chaperone GroES [Candidatus Tectimicrobiota bacterium]